MPGALTPDLALDYLGELSTDIRAAVVLDADGRPLAGERRWPSRRARCWTPRRGASAVEVLTEHGGAFAARGARHSLCVATGRFALPALVLYDLRAVLGDLEPA